MKTSLNFSRLLLFIFGLLLTLVQTEAATFINDTILGVTNTDFDGQDIIVTNCTLTVDGPHAFGSVELQAGAILTHSFASNAIVRGDFISIVDEPHTLSSTNPALLNYTNVRPLTVVVRDLTGTNYQVGVDYGLITTNQFTFVFLPAGSAIPEGASVLISYDASVPPIPAGLFLRISNDFIIESAATINASARGYGAGLGPGTGGSAATNYPYPFTAGGGGAYGGNGAASASQARGGLFYGSLLSPTNSGSGGGLGSSSGGAGGGLINLMVGGALRIDGRITANGENATNFHSGGGAGGSIWLSAQTFTGLGSITANGGAGESPNGGGGGGGRIALQARTNQFGGQISAYGGAGAGYGGAGTLYIISDVITNGQVLLDNGGPLGALTPLSSFARFDLTIAGGAIASSPIVSPFFRNLVIRSNGWFDFGSNASFGMGVFGDAAVLAGGGINGDGNGYPGGQGPGAGQTIPNLSPSSFTGGGGGHGGYGGTSAYGARAGNSYDQLFGPTMSGSGGGGGSGMSPYNLGGAGGGRIALTVSGTLTLDGQITANGLAGKASGSGGGSGGSIWITTGDLAGSGLIAANGGDGEMPFGGGGGGGRIAISYSGSNTFTGTISAHGGIGAHNGSAGTIYSKPGASPFAQVLIDNSGLLATNTPLATTAGLADLVVSGSSTVAFLSTSFRNLLVESNCWLTPLGTESGRMELNVSSNAVFALGSGIRLDGRGAPSGAGQGAGRFGTGSGGGYGGYGGNSLTNSGGGIAYGSMTQPNDIGSGGGTGAGATPGGAGGGTLRLSVIGTLMLDGKITANGSKAPGLAAGGGSGGAIYVNAGTLTGSGAISANGGSGDLPFGGGGGGGRIAIYYNTDSFNGLISARGGAGANYGGAGTIFMSANNRTPPDIIVDNGGVRAAYTLLNPFIAGNLTITGGGIGLIFGTLLATPPLANLVIASNSFLVFSNVSPSRFSLNVASNATVDAGGGIVLDGAGYSGAQGIGAGRVLFVNSNGFSGYTGGGGGYAGFGGNSLFGAAGGIAYGSLTAPIEVGSGGGVSPQIGFAQRSSIGGGALQMNVPGTLTLDGVLTANGFGATVPGAGGGSGGGLWLSVGKLAGSGLIAANGGDGDLPYGGGGGGGRIALYYRTNLFTGKISAHGGAGAIYGGAGTIYLRQSNQEPSSAQVIIDNSGQRGANTSLGTPGLFDLALNAGASLSLSAGPAGANMLFRNLSISSNAWLTSSSNLALQVIASNLTIQAGGGITLDGIGAPGGRGLGAGGLTNSPVFGFTGGGGGYGGYGGPSVANAAGGNSYGSILQPTDFGSGGGSGVSLTASGAGGGALKLLVAGTLALDGLISANGASAFVEGGGGGSGGSLWISAGLLTGNGFISATGGAGDYGQGGGGSGGRIALYYTTNQFSGPISAYGGAGSVYGGAGTIYLHGNRETAGTLVIDNAGIQGTNTPLTAPERFRVSITGDATVHPASPLLVLGGLQIETGGTLTHLGSQSNVDILVIGNAMVQTNGAISADATGYSGDQGGPGSGSVSNSLGSGGGYGGPGGASASGAPGGGTYGSALQPTDRGSRGGSSPILSGFSQGGGAILLHVSSNLTVNGSISANGNFAVIDGSGGGAGGSIWITSRSIDGSGQITANGGNGEASGGGGGGGGRIAINAQVNNFAGAIYAAGGAGPSPGQDGTVVLTNIPAPQIISQLPSDILSSVVDYIDLGFSSLMNFDTASPADFNLNTPNGLLPQSSLSISSTNFVSLRLSFPEQSAIGYYELGAGPQIEDIYGQPMSATYVGSFVILPPVISGHVTDANGQPVAYVTLHPTGGPLPVVTDLQGDYSLEVLPSWTGTLTPSKDAASFIPASRSYGNVVSDLSNQNFVLLTPSALMLNCQQQGPSMNLSWQGIPGASYHLIYSTDLVNWYPYLGNIVGTNGPMSLTVTPGSEPAKFFRLVTSY